MGGRVFARAHICGPLLRGRGLVAKAVTDRYAIAALVRTRALETQLLASVRACASVERIRVIWCSSPEELFRAAVDREAAIAIVEWEAGDYALESLVRRLRDEFPTVPVLAYAPLTSAGARALLAAGRAGVREAIIAGHDDAGRALSEVLVRAATASAAERAVDWISDFVMPDVLPILAYALRHARS